MQVAEPVASKPRKRVALSLAAGLAVAAGAVAVGVLVAPMASAEAGDPLGPTLVKTDAAPTGYAVKFRYQAPAGVNQVHVYGDWYFAQPPNASPNHPPSQWQANDFAATDWRTIAMTKGEDGIWETTVPLPAGTFRYAYTHNCTNQLATGCTLFYDPANPWQIFPQYPNAPGAVRSTFFVPSHPDFPTYDNDYQKPTTAENAGTLVSVRYPSPGSTNPAGVHDMLVYTPKGYDPNRAIPYPTLYISHGAGDHSTAWFMQGVAHYIVQNAIDAGVAQDMVVVSTDFNGLPGGNNGYATHLRDIVFPYMEANYNVSTRSEDRAFGGFSMGGSRAFTILYDFTSLFGYHAAWSWAGGAANAAQVARMKAVPGGIMIGTGLQDTTVTSPGVLARAAALKAQGVPLTELYMNGMHTWHVWRPLLNFYINNMAFRTTTTGVNVEAVRNGNSDMVLMSATATVNAVTTSATPPSGTVDFYAGATLIGSAELQGGTATISRVAVTAALFGEPIVAKYRGDSRFNTSESSPVAGAAQPCANVLSADHSGQLVVSSGLLCVDGATVTGKVTVAAGASLWTDNGATITGPVNATNADMILVCGTRVDAPLTINGATLVAVGNPSVGCAANTVTGPVKLTNATGPSVIGGNSIGGPLDCSANQPAPVNGGAPNQVTGPKKQQCANL